MAKEKTARPRGQWRENIVASYRVTKAAYSWLPFALLAGALVPLLIGILLAFLNASLLKLYCDSLIHNRDNCHDKLCYLIKIFLKLVFA